MDDDGDSGCGGGDDETHDDVGVAFYDSDEGGRLRDCPRVSHCSRGLPCTPCSRVDVK